MKYMISITFVLLLIESCSKEKSMLQTNSNEFYFVNKIYSQAKYRGLYVNDFDNILGDPIKEDSLLNWCKKNKFTAISLYDLGTIMQDTLNNNQKLAHFIQRAKTNFKIKQVAAIRGGNAGFAQTLNDYNNSRADTVERFNVLNLENEWWNNGLVCDFNCYTIDLAAMFNFAHATIPPLIAEEYIGWFQNPNGQEMQQAARLENYSDRVMVHDYRGLPDFNYMKSRLSFLGKAAKVQGKVFEVIVIFSAETSFMFNYFDVNGQNKTFDNAYAEIVSEYNATSFAGKGNIRIIGYQIFTYTDARSARP